MRLSATRRISFRAMAFILWAGSSAFTIGCSAPHARQSTSCERGPSDEPPPPHREFRGAWVATFENLDWPSRGGLTTEMQQKEIDRIIERAKALKLNAIVLQVRSTGNAIYRSDREPWAGLLTGKRGKAPEPFYDPLETWIEKCHRAGIELHAWIVPFVAWKDPILRDGAGPFPTTVPYDGGAYYNPGDKDTQDYVIGVFKDVMTRYDVDGLQMDHYFYPFAIGKNGRIEFNDDSSFEQYVRQGGRLARADWRRENINHFISRLYREIKSRKKWVKFGISPFGIPRPGMPSYAQGFDAYECTYADAPLWLRKGWCDYMAPELYWKTGALHQPFLGLLQWWVDPAHNPLGRQIYAGLFTSRIDWSSTSWCPDEIAGQVMITRLTPGATGDIHFSMRALTQNRRGVADLLASELYKDAALVPPMPWLGDKAPDAPAQLSAERASADQIEAAWPAPLPEAATENPPTAKPAATQPFVAMKAKAPKEIAKQRTLAGFRVTWSPGKPEQEVRVWAVYRKCGGQWIMDVVPGQKTEVFLRDDPVAGAASAVAVAGVDRLGNESPRAKLDLTRAIQR